MIRCRISLRETIQVSKTIVYGRRRLCKPSSYARINDLYKFHVTKDVRINEGKRRISEILVGGESPATDFETHTVISAQF